MTRIRCPSQAVIQARPPWCVYLMMVVGLSLLPALTWARADLMIGLEAPDNANAGDDIGTSLTLNVINRGDRLARGTRSSDNGYMIDIFITRGSMPAGYARYDEHYFDGVLLKGGRVSNTDDLPPLQRASYQTSAILPTDIPPGRYQLCARVDPGNKIPEAREDNNTYCQSLSINLSPMLIRALPGFEMLLPEHRDRELRVIETEQVDLAPPPATPETPVETSDATRTILEDGSIVLTWPDGSKRRLRPDGLVEYVSPDGTIMSPIAIQVEVADLPELPEELSGWGSFLSNDLLAILGNILTDAELEAYQQTEADKGYYERINWRLRSIKFLTALENDE
ncbi:protein nirG [Marinobacter vulgaris]|uniref:Protein nirG n=1 Tax=Marinobacter vulgaris TaxID=1928331 RepID=A0A2V3ZKI7_9GAMM|nr:CARDB domain-containing protein [Marinobacter vulgaris]PXX89538.1 protein nirG [Marinobacter vulgaris]TSJ68529.1 protein nirG [Marinobacter vulgaris]